MVAAALAEGGSDALLVLIQRFRQSFTDALHPKFLPSAWHIMHRYIGCMPVYMCTLTALLHRQMCIIVVDGPGHLLYMGKFHWTLMYLHSSLVAARPVHVFVLGRRIHSGHLCYVVMQC